MTYRLYLPPEAPAHMLFFCYVEHELKSAVSPCTVVSKRGLGQKRLSNEVNGTVSEAAVTNGMVDRTQKVHGKEWCRYHVVFPQSTYRLYCEVQVFCYILV